MKIYKCDNSLCDRRCTEGEMVTLKGYIGRSGGILLLLPDAYQVKHFCNGECFETWLIIEAQVCKKEIAEARSDQNETT